MDCEKARSLIDDDLDGRLDAAERERLETHVASCAACRAAQEELAGLRRLFASVPPVSAPPGLRDAVLAAVPQLRPRRRGRLLRMAPWLGVLAAAAAVLIVAVSLPPSSSWFPGTSEAEVASAPAAAADSGGSAYDAREEPADRAARLRAQPSGAGADLDEAPEVGATPSADVPAREAPDREVLDGKVLDGELPEREAAGAGLGARERKDDRSDAPAPAAAPEPVSAPTLPPPPVSPPRAPPPPTVAPTESRERDRSADGKKLAEGQFGSRLLAERRIVVFSDRAEAERFVAALRGAAAPASGSGATGATAAGGPPEARRPGPAPAPGERADGNDDGDDDDGETAVAKSRRAPERGTADEGLAASGYVATAAATELAEAAASGNASVLAEFSLPAEAPRVSDLLRGALEGRGWAAPLSARLYARARGAQPGLEDGPGGDSGDEPVGGGGAGGSGPSTGAAGARGGGRLAAKNEAGQSESPDPADDPRPGAAATTLRIVVLVLE